MNFIHYELQTSILPSEGIISQILYSSDSDWASSTGNAADELWITYEMSATDLYKESKYFHHCKNFWRRLSRFSIHRRFDGRHLNSDISICKDDEISQTSYFWILFVLDPGFKNILSSVL